MFQQPEEKSFSESDEKLLSVDYDVINLLHRILIGQFSPDVI